MEKRCYIIGFNESKFINIHFLIVVVNKIVNLTELNLKK